MAKEYGGAKRGMTLVMMARRPIKLYLEMAVVGLLLFWAAGAVPMAVTTASVPTATTGRVRRTVVDYAWYYGFERWQVVARSATTLRRTVDLCVASSLPAKL